MSNFQTTTTDTPPTAARPYKGLGFKGGPGQYMLRNLFGMVIGEQNSGKSYLFQSCGDAFIINLDLSSTVVPEARCITWPGIGSDGCPVDVDGRSITLTWDLVERKIQQLCDFADRKEERPAMVVFDTLSPMIRMLKPWVANKLGRATFEACHGPAAWETLYEAILDACFRLKAKGYGVWLISHVSRNWVEISENSKVEEHNLVIPPGLRLRLSALVEFIVPIRGDFKTVSEDKFKTVKVGNSIVKQPYTEERQILKRTIAFQDPRYGNLVKPRSVLPIPDIDITDSKDPWALLEAAYNKANAPAT